jgi:hypothetical protein
MRNYKKTLREYYKDSIQRADKDNLEIIEYNDEVCMVNNLDTHGSYFVTIDIDEEKVTSCTCPHFIYRLNYFNIPCKHMICVANYYHWYNSY